VLRKTTLYGALGMCLAFLFAMVENVLSVHVAARLGFPEGSGGWLAGGLVALTIGPLRSRLEKRTDRIIDRLLPPGELARGARRHSVIVFADLAGYSNLSSTQPDEALTCASLLHKVAQRAANRFRGRVVKTLGDGALLDFADPSGAVQATTFAADSYAAAAVALDLPTLPLTAGIHAGEVVEGPDGDIYGEPVNVAARMEAAAEAGDIWISTDVASQLRLPDEELSQVGEVQVGDAASLACFRLVRSRGSAG
jgi:class 3 adenylate cyclase